MDRSYYLDLAAQGLRMPIGTDLVLREKPDHEAILLDGLRFGRVVEEAARRYKAPLAILLMDLLLEKRAMLERIGVSAKDVDSYHFAECPTDAMLAAVDRPTPPIPRIRANLAALRYLADSTDLIPVGMCIGPFSLSTKLLSDPITPVFMAGAGSTAEDDPEVKTFERVLEMSTRLVLESVALQCDAGAKAIFIAEPAANKVYFSPNQLAAGSDIFERYAMAANRRVRKLLADRKVDLIFHCCGELVDDMVTHFGKLDPAILSLGSSRKLWEDARLVPKTTVLYGNLPSKKFYSDDAITEQEVRRLSAELLERMRATGHPFILGSECDVLSVPGAEAVIRRKVDAILNCGCH